MQRPRPLEFPSARFRPLGPGCSLGTDAPSVEPCLWGEAGSVPLSGLEECVVAFIAL